VFAIATGAMFSSGFFLLPGLAAAKGGPSVALAYLLAGILILPAMFSKAELSTALPRAGGTYYFLDRALGPMFGTIGGLGTYLALTLKTTFALIGIGAYAVFFVELPIKPVAIALTVAIAVINIVGAKETSGLQRVLVVVLLAILAYFISFGLIEVGTNHTGESIKGRFSPFFAHGIEGLLSTIGFVFVSYAGLTKVASIAEEVKDPERNIPLGMMLSLGVTTLVYVTGVFVIVAVMDPAALHSDLTPVASAAQEFTVGLPVKVTILLVSIAAIAAFLSTGNAGVMSASRYPLAMSRDRLLPAPLSRIGKYHTPTLGICMTAAIMIVCILTMNEEGIAKLASAFQLFIFMLVCFAVIVLRESQIPSYDPGYRSPLYPWMQIMGILVSLVLIVAMGMMPILFTLGTVIICYLWFHFYARPRVARDGAIYHWFNLLGQRQYDELDREFRTILKEKGMRLDDPFDQVIARAQVVDMAPGASFEEIVREASILFSDRIPVDSSTLESGFMKGTQTGATPTAGGAALPHLHVSDIDAPEIVLARSPDGIRFEVADSIAHTHVVDPVYAIFFLVSPEGNPRMHLRLLAHLANIIDNEHFIESWKQASSATQIKELLLKDTPSLTLRLSSLDSSSALINAKIKDVEFPSDCILAVIRREDKLVVPRGDVTLLEGDLITFIGEPDVLSRIRQKYEASS